MHFMTCNDDEVVDDEDDEDDNDDVTLSLRSSESTIQP